MTDIAGKVIAVSGLDAVINTVGGFAMSCFAEDSFETWRQMHTTNTETAFTLTQAAIPLLQQRGSGARAITGRS